MKIEYFYIKGFRRIKEMKILCGEATFLIGENNIGKSSILKALEIFFGTDPKLHEQDFFKVDEIGYQVDEVIFEAKFYDISREANEWRGFKGRLIRETIKDIETDCIYYRKTFSKNGALKREMKSCNKSIKEEFVKCKSLRQFIEAGLSEEIIEQCFEADFDKEKNLVAKDKDKLDLISEIWDIDEANQSWVTNPGGIEGNISIKLPKFLLIPAENRKEEIEGVNGTLQKTMKELFDEVRGASENYRQAQHYLDLLAQELDPEDGEKEFGRMLLDLNKIISGILTQIHISTNLSDPSSVIKPTFEIEMSSNVRTKPERQGMGAIRSTVFALLRYREHFVERKRAEGVDIRPLIIGFEEPEMYLHPNAASLMREKIYELATSTNSKIICTTHSPYMIDLSRKMDEADFPKQVLNLLKLTPDVELNTSITVSHPFNTTEAYLKLQNNDKQFIKFLLKIDDSIAKVFFCKRVIIVEGDTEELLIKETVQRLPEEKKKKFLCDYQVVKARGKSVIISLVKYLDILGIKPFVIHDEDIEAGAIKFNNPILESLDNFEDRRLMIQYTIEDILGYEEPTCEKPYTAYKHIEETWGEDWEGVHKTWKGLFERKVSPELFN